MNFNRFDWLHLKAEYAQLLNISSEPIPAASQDFKQELSVSSKETDANNTIS